MCRIFYVILNGGIVSALFLPVSIRLLIFWSYFPNRVAYLTVSILKNIMIQFFPRKFIQFESTMNASYTYPTELIFVPIESPGRELSIGTKISSV